MRHTVHGSAVATLASSIGLAAPVRQQMHRLMKMAEETDRVLVLIYLDGGNDGLNTVVPLDQMSALANARPHVLLPENSLHTLGGTSVGLHPSLSGFKSLFDEGRLKIIQSVGYPQPNYSHFRSTDIWMSGSNADELVNTGWSGRYLQNQYPAYPESFPSEEMPDPLAIEIGFGASLLFQGPTAAMSMVISGPESFHDLVDNVEQPAPDGPAGDKLRYVRLIARQSQQYGQQVMQAAKKANNQVEFPKGNRLAQQLGIVSRLIAGGLKTPLYMVRLGGFDTHDAQVANGDTTRGEHADLLSDLNHAVMAFMQDLEAQNIDDKVMGMTFSEFGRTIMSNTSNGTDHGTTAPMFLFGSTVAGGLTGTNPVIPSSVTYEDDLEMQYDFRQVYQSVLTQWMGMTKAGAEGVLGDSYDGITLVKGGSGVTGLEEFGRGRSDLLSVYPNPLNGQATISFESYGEPVRLDVLDMRGKVVHKLYRGTLPSGKQSLVWDTHHLPTGQYMVLMRTASYQQGFRVAK